MSRFSQLKDGDILDRDTGEVLEKDQYTLTIKKNTAKLKEKWFMSFQTSFRSLAMDKELRGEPRAILDLMFSVLDFENRIPLHQAKIAEILGMYQSNASKAIKKLLDKNIIALDVTEGKNQFYKLNPEYCWKGKVNKLHKIRTDFNNIIKLPNQEKVE